MRPVFALAAVAFAHACDPAASWMAYAVSKGNGKPITNVSVSFKVPSLPKKSGSNAAFWWGIEPVPACDLLQPVLALGREKNSR
jgi:hypothetical protein